MALAQEAQDLDTHPYTYGHIRWFESDESYATGWNAQQLDHISFVNANLSGAFSFLDPTKVIHATHLIMVFAHGSMSQLLQGKSIARLDTDYDLENKHEDWRYFYVNR
ncbi:hypothetical protein CVT25_000395 [Psilocybe cyanescens]|uniref:Uncharacterized protein n=1 Tax=Psilocybe cyanescens TaxID=93625 RepID=A0A409XU45_PSICY|nr:hypothetical protein CVT25_000395 [Psilocybe cyanescens]